MYYLVCSFFTVIKATFSVKKAAFFCVYSKLHIWCQSSHDYRQQCKWLSTTNLDDGIYLRTIQIRALTGWLSHLSPFSATSAMVWFCEKLRQKDALLHAELLLKVISLEHYQLQPLCILWLLFFPHISLWSPGSCHTLRIFLLVKIFNFFLTTPLLYTTSCLQEILLFSTSSLWKLGLPSPPHFSQSKHMIKWMMFPWLLNWKIQDMQPLFGHSVIKIYDKATQPLQLTSWRFLLEMFSHTQSPIVYCLLAFMI